MDRIAYICADPGVPVFGGKGASVHVQEVLRGFVDAGAEVELFATRLGGEPPSDLRSIEIHRLPEPPNADRGARERACLAANETLSRRLWPRFDLVYERYSLWSYAGMRFARQRSIPGVLEVNAPLIEEQISYRGLADVGKAREVAHCVFRNATALVAVSHEVAQYLRTWPSATASVHVIPNGVNTRRFDVGVRGSSSRPTPSLTVGFVGSLKPWHGVSTLFKAFQLINPSLPMNLLIVGDGPERARLQEDAARQGLCARVEWTGSVPPEVIPQLLARMDIAVAPYPDLPGFYFSPLKLFEYMAAGRPVITSRIGQIPSIIAHGENGWLTAPGDAVDLAAALDLLGRDPDLRQRLGTAGRRAAVEKHAWEHVIAKIWAIARGRRLTEAAELASGALAHRALP